MLDAQKIEVDGASVDFFISLDAQTYYFDTSKTVPPEPMVNAMVGLKLISNTSKKLVMINHSKPVGLFSRISDNYEYEVQLCEDEKYKITFVYKQNSTLSTDFDDNMCSG